MPYCSSTGKFAGFDEPEGDIQNESVDGSTASFEVQIVRPCSECGDTSSEYNAELEVDIDHVCDPAVAKENGYTDFDAEEAEANPQFDTNSFDVEVEDYMQTHGRNGKPLTGPMRYRKHLYAVQVSGTVECQHCGVEIDITAEERDIAASAFDTEAH